ncbi:MAG: hypothetical protein JO040_08810 [Gemmatimonadetes bacterium]|nr:hypothetical protein [Gemmatimonadota bacterium]
MILLPHFTRSLLTRSLVTWLFVRAVVTVGSAALGVPPDPPFSIPPLAVVLVVGIVAVVGWVYARRRNEDQFLLCLGYGPVRLLGMLALPALLLELGIGIAARL